MKVSRQNSFAIVTLFCMSVKLFYMKIQDGTVHYMDSRQSMRGSVKVFSRRSAYTICHETFLPRNFHGIRYAGI